MKKIFLLSLLCFLLGHQCFCGEVTERIKFKIWLSDWRNDSITISCSEKVRSSVHVYYSSDASYRRLIRPNRAGVYSLSSTHNGTISIEYTYEQPSPYSASFSYSHNNTDSLSDILVFSSSDVSVWSNVDIQCPTLTKLIYESREQTNLALSDCSALSYLDCSNNNLSSLDLRNNTALSYLDCSNNKLLTSLKNI